MQILPAILARTEQEFIEKVEKVRSLGLMLHIDVMDGKFVPESTWAEPGRIVELLKELKFEAHLMVEHPEQAVPAWFKAGADRVIFHAEATTQDSHLIKTAGTRAADLGMALNPDTPISRIMPGAPLPFIMIMGVYPGRDGQSLQEIALEKIKETKMAYPQSKIIVDGGVTIDNAAQIQTAGADILIIGSHLTGTNDCAAALRSFQEALYQSENKD